MIGNTLSNISNNGLAALYKGDIYFVNIYRGEDLYRQCGKMYAQITEDKVKGINIINDTIYYTTLTGSLKKIDINGENSETILDGDVDNIIVTEEHIFYVNTFDKYSIYRYDLNTKENKKICSNICDKINLYNGYIYYINCTDDLDWYGSGNIHKVDINGEKDEMVIDILTNNIIVDNNNIYYILEEYNHKISRFNIESNNIEDIIEKAVSTFSINNDNIYFGNLDDEGKLYKVNINNKVVEKISDDIPENINIAGEYMYFANSAYGYPYRLYKMKLDGSEKQMV